MKQFKRKQFWEISTCYFYEISLSVEVFKSDS